jgi:hypothetical protein
LVSLVFSAAMGWAWEARLFFAGRWIIRDRHESRSTKLGRALVGGG